jgi:Protein of unknown function (DUF1501)
MARRLVEHGVRMVQVYFGNGQPWDHHGDIREHAKLARQSFGAIAALITDLKTRGLLAETLIIVGTEFARAGVRSGMTYGTTDEFGFKAVEKRVHVHDLHATALHLLGLDHKRLTYRYSSRDFRLTDVRGEVIHDILA